MDTKIIFENNELMLLGFKEIVLVNPTILHIKFKEFELKIFGINLGIKYYSQKEILLGGNILRIEKKDEL